MKHKFLTTLLTAAAFIYASGLPAFTPDFGKCRLRSDEKQNSYWIVGPANELVGGIGAYPKQEFQNMKVSLDNGTLNLDSTGMFHGKSSGNGVIMRFYQIDLKTAYLAPHSKTSHTMTNRVTIEIKSEAPGHIGIYFEGTEQINGKQKHFWKLKNTALTGKDWQTVTFDQVLPDTLKKMWIRIDVSKPMKLQIRSVRFGKIANDMK